MTKYVFKNKWKSAVISCIDVVGRIIFSYPRRLSIESDPKEILVVRLDQVGDVIQALPFFSALRKKYPNATITALCAASTEFLLLHHPSVDKVIAMKSSWFYREKKWTLTDLCAVAAELRTIKVDLAFELRGDFRNILLLFLSGTKRIIGYGCTGGGFLLAKEYAYEREAHELDKNLKLLGETPKKIISITFAANEEAEREAERIFVRRGEGRTLVVHPFTRAASKMWGIDRYNALIGRVMECSETVTIFVIGSAEERPLVQGFGWSERLIDCTGALSFSGTLSLIQRADLFVGNDSGPQFMAAYSGKKTCVIYGDTVNYLRWKPKVRDEDFVAFSKDVYCGPCESNVCLNRKEGHLCMDIITVEEVFFALKRWL